VVLRDVGAHTTEDVIRQGSRVSLCAGRHVVASVISGQRWARKQNAPPGTWRRRGVKRSFFSRWCALRRAHPNPEACVEPIFSCLPARGTRAVEA
jgi:hypothetical protein